MQFQLDAPVAMPQPSHASLHSVEVLLSYNTMRPTWIADWLHPHQFSDPANESPTPLHPLIDSKQTLQTPH